LNIAKIIILYLCVYLEHPSPKLLRCSEHEVNTVINKNVLLHPCTSIPCHNFFSGIAVQNISKVLGWDIFRYMHKYNIIILGGVQGVDGAEMFSLFLTLCRKKINS